MIRQIYVAAGFKSYAKARAVIDHLKNLGFGISFDWTRTSAFGPDGHPTRADRTKEEDAEYAKNDVWGVEAADALVLMGDTNPYGGLMEAGMAMRNNRKEVLIICPERESVFFCLPNVHVFNSYVDFFTYMERIKR